MVLKHGSGSLHFGENMVQNTCSLRALIFSESGSGGWCGSFWILLRSSSGGVIIAHSGHPAIKATQVSLFETPPERPKIAAALVLIGVEALGGRL